MSYRLSKVRDAADIKRRDDGAPLCMYPLCGRHGAYSRRAPTPAVATTVYVVRDPYAFDRLHDGLSVVCAKHAGTIKGLKARGVRDWSDHRVIPMPDWTVERAVADPVSVVDAGNAIIDARFAETARLKALRIADAKPGAIASFLSDVNATYDNAIVDRAVVLGAKDDYGLSNVVIKGLSARPALARAIAMRLLDLADDAEKAAKDEAGFITAK